MIPEDQDDRRAGKAPIRLTLLFGFQHQQCELPAEISEKLAVPEERAIDPIDACEKMLAGMPKPPEILHAADKAFYFVGTDRITMPARRLFENAQKYW